MPRETMVAAVQMRAIPRALDRNLMLAEKLLREACSEGAEVVLLPELFNVGFFLGRELFDLWETSEGKTVTWMRQRSTELGVTLAGTIAERRGEELFNSLLVVEPSGTVHRYAKRNPIKTERAAFEVGGDPSVLHTHLGNVGSLICADLNLGESLIKPMVGNVELLLVPQANPLRRSWGRLVSRLEARRGRPLYASRLSAVGAPALVAGQIGPAEKPFRGYFYGSTWVTGPDGSGLASVPYDTEGIALATVQLGSEPDPRAARKLRDPSRFAAKVHERILPDLADLRPQARSA